MSGAPPLELAEAVGFELAFQNPGGLPTCEVGRDPAVVGHQAAIFEAHGREDDQHHDRCLLLQDHAHELHRPLRLPFVVVVPDDG